MSAERLVLGTRGSALALAQSGQVAFQLGALTGAEVELRVLRTRGDEVQDRPLPEVGGKGLFTAELELALRAGVIDLAVHSLKDLPTEAPEGLMLGAYPEREDPRDALIGGALAELPPAARVGTGSARRQVQLLALRPDLQVLGVRGNVDTRLRKLQEGQYDALVLAMAGLSRLGLRPAGLVPLDPADCTPAPGQGALGLQCRADDVRMREHLALLDHAPTRAAVLAERAFLAALHGGCSVPAGALARVEGQTLRLRCAWADPAGLLHRWAGEGPLDQPEALGARAARELLGR